MATRIDHGPPGSYKSLSIVQNFGIPALIAGRTVVSNVRAFSSLATIQEQFPETKFPASARLYFVDTSTAQGRMFLACWYAWVPFNTMILIDEAQRIYPDRRDFKLESLDKYQPPKGLIKIDDLPEGRPEDIFTGFDMQRHYQWDLFLTTPNIAKIKREIREVAEWAYRHRDLSTLLPWTKNQWYEHQHDPENNGKSTSQRVGAAKRHKADPRIFNVYQSTATGDITDSQAGTSVFSDSSIRFKFAIVFLAIAAFSYLFATNSSRLFGSKTVPVVSQFTDPVIVSSVSIPDDKDHVSSGATDIRVLPAVQIVSYADTNIDLTKLVSVSRNNFHDARHLELNMQFKDEIVSIKIDDLRPFIKNFDVKGLCDVSILTKDDKTIKLTCFHSTEYCASELKAEYYVSRRHCSVRGTQQTNKTSHALSDIVQDNSMLLNPVIKGSS